VERLYPYVSGCIWSISFCFVPLLFWLEAINLAKSETRKEANPIAYPNPPNANYQAQDKHIGKPSVIFKANRGNIYSLA
jgi:hypothetical protein